jgi:magnesium-transporting ATPase (P-type)
LVLMVFPDHSMSWTRYLTIVSRASHPTYYLSQLRRWCIIFFYHSTILIIVTITLVRFEPRLQKPISGSVKMNDITHLACTCNPGSIIG